MSAATSTSHMSKRPGYGISTRTASSTQRDVGAPLIEASNELFPNRPIVLGGHDRGARLCHRLAVDHAHPPTPLYNSFELLGMVALDIVPTLIQWQAFANPKASIAYFHWPLLAFPDAADIIEAYGGDRWVHTALDRIGGSNEIARKAFKSDQAWEVYESLFRERETIEGSCADYAAAADPEPDVQKEDQGNGRQVEVPLLIMWSLAKLGKMHGDLGSIWRNWVKKDVPVKAVGCGEDVGHYLPEEASDFIAATISGFVDELGA